MACRHCHKIRATRPRGLCWTCYYTPGVREQYPSMSPFVRHGVADFCGRGAAPSQPTRALPGTPEKVAVLEQRARLGQRLWHALDAPCEPKCLAEVG